MNLFDALTRPIRARLAAWTFGVSVAYATKVLQLMEKADRGKLSQDEVRFALHCVAGEYPEDYQKARTSVFRR